MNRRRLTWLMQPLFFMILLCLCAASTIVRGLEQNLFGPQTVMWVVVKDANNPTPYWLNADRPNGAATYLERLGAKRGIPIVVPLLDLADTNMVTEQNVLEGSLSPLQKAAERYHAEALLIGKIEQTTEGEWIAEWTSSMNGKTSNFEARHADFNGVLNAGLSGFLTRLVGQTVEPRHPQIVQNNEQPSITDQAALQNIENNIEIKSENKNDSQETNTAEEKKTIKLSISGITGVAHYAKVLEYLKKLPSVTEVAVLQITPQHTIFQIDSPLTKEVFANAINESKWLVPSMNEAIVQDALCYKIAE